jgi:hypothetical protein
MKKTNFEKLMDILLFAAGIVVASLIFYIVVKIILAGIGVFF